MAAAAGRLGWLLAALCLGNAAGEAAPDPRVLGVCLEEDGAAGAGWAHEGEVRAAPEATFRLRLFGSGFSNSSWSWVAPEGAGCPEGGPAAYLVKAMVFPVVMYGCKSWTIKKAEHQRIDAFELWCWRRLWRAPWTARRSNQSILKEISPEC